MNADPNRKRGKKFEVELENGKKEELYIRRPTQKELFAMDSEYRLAMTSLIKKGVATESRLRDMLKENGEWTNDHENESRNLVKMIGQFEIELEEKKEEREHEDNVRLAQKILNMRIRQYELAARRFLLFENSAERLAEQQKMHIFAAKCCCSESDDQAYFKDDEAYEEFVNDNFEAASKILAETYSFEYGADEAQEWVEAQFLNETADKAFEPPPIMVEEKAKKKRKSKEKKKKSRKSVRRI